MGLLLAVLFFFALPGGANATDANEPIIQGAPTHVAVKGSSSVGFNARYLPPELTEVQWRVRFGTAFSSEPTIRPGAGVPINSLVYLTPVPGETGTWQARVEFPSPMTNPGRLELARIGYSVEAGLPERSRVVVSSGLATDASGETHRVAGDISPMSVVMVTDVATLFALLAGVVGFVYWLSTLTFTQGFFRYLPPLIWMYFIPMTFTTIGIIPDASPLYSPFMTRIILPAVLVLLLIPSDLRGLSRLGLKAFLMMLFATSGIVVGAIVSFGIFNAFFGDSFPEGTWKGIAALSGSWIGGSANMFAVLESIQTPPSIIGPMVIVDTVLAYSWLGLLIALSAYQDRVDAHHRADRKAIEEMAAKLSSEKEEKAKAPAVADIAMMIGLAFVVSQLCLYLAQPIFYFMDEVLELKAITSVVNAYGWGILLLTLVGLLLSLTPARQLEFRGASSIGYVGLYLLLTGYGAQANFRAILEVPLFFGIGALWMAIHITFLYVGLRVLRAPMVLAATSSMANIGGTASAPVVAASYNQSLAPLGLIMAILGSTLGTPLALFVVATTTRALSGG